MSAAKAPKGTPAPKAKSKARPAAAPVDLARWIGGQRWYARTADAPVVARTDRIELPTAPAVTVVVATLRDGARYQLVQRGDGPDAASTAEVATAIARFATSTSSSASTTAGSDGAVVRAHAVGSPTLGPASARPLGAEQSNTSAMVGGTHVLKVLRRLVPGVHPEVEVGLHLAGAPDVPVPRLAGWYELVEGDGETTVLGVVHELVPGALDGWALVLSSLAGDPGGILARLHDLGGAIARTHRALGRPGDGFGTAPLDPTALWALADRLLADPLLPPDGHHLVARAVEAIGTDPGAAIRVHGDLHLGQTLLGGEGWMLLDFEGEPDRPVAERRVHASPLRDVAGMLRSLAYAAAAHERSGGTPLSAGWEPAARAALLDGYLAEVDPELLPRAAASVEHLLTLLELEKVLYEVAYERAHRPDWEAIPLAGLDRLVAQGRRPTRGTS